MPAGRPLKFQDIDVLEERIQAYFDECDPHVVEVTEWVDARDSEGKLKRDQYGLNYLIEITHKIKTGQVAYTITGLAEYLDTSRETLLEYEDRPEFVDTIKRAKDKVHAFIESRLFDSNPAGVIFNLKNNFNWRDKNETEISGGPDPVKLLLQKYGLTEDEIDDGKADKSVQDPR